MGMASLEPSDREAISQLRALLRSDSHLTTAQEEELIAAFLPARVPAHQAIVDGRPIPKFERIGALVQPAVVEAAVVGAGALISVQYALGSGESLYYFGYNTDPAVTAVAAGAGMLLLALPLLRAWFGLQVRRVPEIASTGVSAVLGVALLEFAALHWPTIMPSRALHHFTNDNMLVLIVSALIVAVLAAFGRFQRRGSSNPSHGALLAGSSHDDRGTAGAEQIYP